MLICSQASAVQRYSWTHVNELSFKCTGCGSSSKGWECYAWAWIEIWLMRNFEGKRQSDGELMPPPSVAAVADDSGKLMWHSNWRHVSELNTTTYFGDPEVVVLFFLSQGSTGTTYDERQTNDKWRKVVVAAGNFQSVRSQQLAGKRENFFFLSNGVVSTKACKTKTSAVDGDWGAGGVVTDKWGHRWLRGEEGRRELFPSSRAICTCQVPTLNSC